MNKKLGDEPENQLQSVQLYPEWTIFATTTIIEQLIFFCCLYRESLLIEK